MPMSAFVMTNKGLVVDRKYDIDRSKVTSLGLAVSISDLRNRTLASSAGQAEVSAVADEARQERTGSTGSGSAPRVQSAVSYEGDGQQMAAGDLDFRLEVQGIWAEGLATSA